MKKNRKPRCLMGDFRLLYRPEKAVHPIPSAPRRTQEATPRVPGMPIQGCLKNASTVGSLRRIADLGLASWLLSDAAGRFAGTPTLLGRTQPLDPDVSG